jgi:hypothetical protein
MLCIISISYSADIFRSFELEFLNCEMSEYLFIALENNMEENSENIPERVNGWFYFNRKDKRLFPPQGTPLPFGWAINWGHPSSLPFWILMIGWIIFFFYIVFLK